MDLINIRVNDALGPWAAVILIHGVAFQSLFALGKYMYMQFH